MAPADDARKDSDEEDEEEIDPDAAPAPEPFRAPKGLLKMRSEDGAPVPVKSGASVPPAAPPPATPPGAAVRRDQRPPVATPPGAAGAVDIRFQKPEGGPKPHVPMPEELGTPDIRFSKPEAKPRPRLPTAEDLGTPDIQMQKGIPKLQKIEPVGEFDVVQPHVVPEPHPAGPLPSPLEGPVDVIIDNRKTGNVDVTGQVPDPFTDRRRIGVVDTTFARFNMGDVAEAELRSLGGDLEIVRRTVPGVKDLAVECKLLVEKQGCELVVACGMVGRMPVDKTCGHEASLAIQWTQLQTNRHILEVFVHEDEAKDERQLAWLMEQRTREHAANAWYMVFDPEELRRNAGRGLRQGFEDAGPIPLR